MSILAQNKPGIYEIQNTINWKKYIGSSMNVQGRISHHFKLLRYGSHHNNHFQAAYKKYGKEAFAYKVLLYCEEFELIRYEQFFIDSKKPEYNKAPIAGRSSGIKRSEETRAKLRWNATHRSQETRDKISKSNSGKRQSEESNKKRSEKMKGRIFSKETLDKISAALRGRKFTPEWIEKNRKAQIGKKVSDETKKKLSLAGTGRKHSLETRLKMSKSAKGKKFTPEHCKNISIAKRKIKNEL